MNPVVQLIDLGELFWREALGGNDPMRGYDESLGRLMQFRGVRAIVCGDSPRSIRKERHESYKSNRKPKPPEAVDALEGVIARARTFMPVVIVDGWEADDVIATLTYQLWPGAVRIWGSEKDFYTLMQEDRVELVRSNGQVVTPEDCFTKFGVAPSQMVDWLALVGDAADGIQGCPHCGPARASALLGQYGTLNEVLEAAESGALQQGTIPGVGPKTIEALKAWSPDKALELVRMNDSLPIRVEDYLGRV